MSSSLPSTPLPPEPVREALLAHLEGLFSLAQVVTLNADAAVALVEATYRRAYERLAETPVPEDPRTWLFGLLLEVNAAEPGAAGTPDAAGERAPAHGADDLRRRLAEQFVHQALPAAFATLPPDRRLLLMLCHVQHLTCEEAGRLLGLAPDVACARLETARRDLHAALYDNATEVERHLLATTLPPDWDRAALAHLARTELVPVPPTLRPAVERGGHAEGGDAEAVPPAALVPAAPGAGRAAPPLPTTPAGPPGGWSRVFTRATATLLLILVAGLMGYVFSGLLRQQPDVGKTANLLNLTVEQERDAEPAVRTESPEQAERLVRDQLGWRLMVPSIDDARLVGVDLREITDGVRVPVFVYEDASQALITLYAYSYAFLDRHAPRLSLERDVLHQIEDDGNFDLYDLGEERVLIWRNRDDIFIAVTPTSVSDLRGRIVFPS